MGSGCTLSHTARNAKADIFDGITGHGRRIRRIAMKSMERRERTGRLTSTRKLLSASWADDVDTIETEIRRSTDERPLAGDCDVAFFEIAADEKLHVNVTHRFPTREIRGWAGPAR